MFLVAGPVYHFCYSFRFYVIFFHVNLITLYFNLKSGHQESPSSPLLVFSQHLLPSSNLFILFNSFILSLLCFVSFIHCSVSVPQCLEQCLAHDRNSRNYLLLEEMKLPGMTVVYTVGVVSNVTFGSKILCFQMLGI